MSNQNGSALILSLFALAIIGFGAYKYMEQNQLRVDIAKSERLRESRELLDQKIKMLLKEQKHCSATLSGKRATDSITAFKYADSIGVIDQFVTGQSYDGFIISSIRLNTPTTSQKVTKADLIVTLEKKSTNKLSFLSKTIEKRYPLILKHTPSATHTFAVPLQVSKDQVVANCRRDGFEGTLTSPIQYQFGSSPGYSANCTIYSNPSEPITSCYLEEAFTNEHEQNCNAMGGSYSEQNNTCIRTSLPYAEKEYLKEEFCNSVGGIYVSGKCDTKPTGCISATAASGGLVHTNPSSTSAISVSRQFNCPSTHSVARYGGADCGAGGKIEYSRNALQASGSSSRWETSCLIEASQTAHYWAWCCPK
ncbi:MAG: hypothetical protein N4A33_07485 [Bacteriovoracaceae bacterium]|nr:hypothetical protein [Bacteriovoracaceae bacterium]